ncbi:RNA-binding domain-containing protein [Pseudothermotoga sp. U03pept]|uniref:RNA-binding domain-containing protein n=1 Tax=Pseudothermotoga sp. U03pept TaxID=3447012 RepID=UPI003EFEF7A3
MLHELLRMGENERVEFKSDRKGQLKLDTIIEAVVCLANHKGGYLVIGVEDDGSVSGTPRSKTETVEELRAKIYAKTRPHTWVKIWAEKYEEKDVIIIEIPKQVLTATADGKYLRRGVEGDNRPSCLPLEPHEILSVLTFTGQKDMTAEKLSIGKEALDESAVELLLKITKQNQAELRNLSVDEILRILGIVTSEENITLAGLLVCGKDTILHEFMPFHEVILNYFDGTELKEQKVYHTNLTNIFFDLMSIYKIYNKGIGEVIKDGIRYEIPLIDNESYREAVSNALIHRDFSIAGSVSINWYEDGRLVISNPGGFVEGVTVENILSITPYPRNPLLSELFRRTGIVEKTGRGVDKIFVGQAKYGKSLPIWDVNSKHVSLILIGSKWKREIAERLLGEDFTPEELLIMYHLYNNDGKTTLDELSKAVQRRKEEVMYFVWRLEDRGFVQRTNENVFGKEKFKVVARSQEEMVIEHIKSKGSITRSEVAQLLNISPSTALRMLQKLVQKGTVRRIGTRGGAKYVLN